MIEDSVESDKDLVGFRVNVTPSKYSGWTDTVIVGYRRHSLTEDRILENDVVTIHGEFKGLISYETIFHQKITVPSVFATEIKVTAKNLVHDGGTIIDTE